MGFLSRLFGGLEPPTYDMTTPVTRIRNGPGTFSVDVVGESRFQDALTTICGGRTARGHRLRVEAFLVPQDNNPGDRHAVRVYIDRKTVGFLEGATARQFRRGLHKAGLNGNGVAVRCNAIIVGGWDRGGEDQGFFGVKLDLPNA